MNEEKVSKPKRKRIPLDQILADWEICEYRTHPPADVAIWNTWYVTDWPADEVRRRESTEHSQAAAERQSPNNE